jgi:hypothetical protein
MVSRVFGRQRGRGSGSLAAAKQEGDLAAAGAAAGAALQEAQATTLLLHQNRLIATIIPLMKMNQLLSTQDLVTRMCRRILKTGGDVPGR